MKRIPIVIVGYNGVDYTQACIESIYQNTKEPFTIVAVNNGSTDGTKELFENYSKNKDNFIFVNSPENLGFGGGYNLGIKEAYNSVDFDYIVILNNDTIATPGWLNRLLKAAQTDNFKIKKDLIGMVGPVSNYVSGRQCVQIPNLATNKDIFDFSEKQYNTYKETVVETGRLIGFCLLIPKKALDVVLLKDGDVFDPIFGKAFYEDNDLALRISNAGFKQLIAQDTFIYHFGSKTVNRADNKISANDLLIKNRQVFIDKWANINKTNQRKVIVGLCRVKNGEQYIPYVMPSVSKMCDKIVVFDDHSTDKTAEMVRAYSNVVYIRSPFEETVFNEARDRNFLLQEGKKLNSDYFYSFDIDECPEDSLVDHIQDLVNCKDPEKKAFIFRISHFWDDDKHIRMDGLWGGFWQCRLFKNEPNQVIQGDEDGLHCGSTPSFPIENMAQTYYRIKHYGNMDPEGRKKKYEWYTKTDTDKDLGNILGGWIGYYKDLYYGDTTVTLKDSDAYRHLIDTKNIRLIPWVERNNISLCIIAKNEAKYLETAIKSVQNFVDEIVIGIDDRSTDETETIAKKYTSKVYKFTWDDNFSDARNFVLRKATGHWVLFLDADEVVPSDVISLLHEAIEYTDVDAYLCSLRNWTSDPKKAGAEYTISETIRLFKNIPQLFYSGCVHEDIADSLSNLNTTLNRKGNLSRFRGIIDHYGYLKDSKYVKEKHQYYGDILSKLVVKYPNDFRAALNYAVHLFHTGDYNKAEIYYKKALEINPKLWAAYNDLGTIYYKKAFDSALLSQSQRYFQSALGIVQSEPLVGKHNVSKVFSNLNAINNLRNSLRDDSTKYPNKP